MKFFIFAELFFQADLLLSVKSNITLLPENRSGSRATRWDLSYRAGAII